MDKPTAEYQNAPSETKGNPYMGHGEIPREQNCMSYYAGRETDAIPQQGTAPQCESVPEPYQETAEGLLNHRIQRLTMQADGLRASGLQRVEDAYGLEQLLHCLPRSMPSAAERILCQMIRRSF